MNQNEKSEAQLRNEETVRRIMAERGYDRSSVKKKKSNKSFAKPLTLFGLTVIFLVSAVIITIIAMNDDNNSKGNTSFNANYQFKGKSKNNDNDDEVNTQIQNETNNDNNLDNSNSQSNSSSTNTYKNNTQTQTQTQAQTQAQDQTQPRQEYNDTRTPFDHHHCDIQEYKYNNAMSEVDKLNIVWQNVYNSQTSYTELYKRANKDANLAKKWMAEEQQAVDDAMKALKEAQATANSIYQDEVLPCHKEMHGQ